MSSAYQRYKDEELFSVGFKQENGQHFLGRRFNGHGSGDARGKIFPNFVILYIIFANMFPDVNVFSYIRPDEERLAHRTIDNEFIFNVARFYYNEFYYITAPIVTPELARRRTMNGKPKRLLDVDADDI